MVNPKVLCTKHLLGEHVETHMLVGAIAKGQSLRGYLRNNLLELPSIATRHSALVEEMCSRGFLHKSGMDREALDKTIISQYSIADRSVLVDSNLSLAELLGRCSKCLDRYKALGGE